MTLRLSIIGLLFISKDDEVNITKLGIHLISVNLFVSCVEHRHQSNLGLSV